MDVLAVAEDAGDVAEGAAVGDLDPGELGPVPFRRGPAARRGDRVAGGFRDGGHRPSLCRAGTMLPVRVTTVL